MDGCKCSARALATTHQQLILRFSDKEVPSDIKISLIVSINYSNSPNPFPRSLPSPPGAWGIDPFYIPTHDTRHSDTAHASNNDSDNSPFNLTAPTTARNAARVLRGMQLRKAVLLEGSPGVGKTTLVAALAKAAGRTLVRINLSEQARDGVGIGWD